MSVKPAVTARCRASALSRMSSSKIPHCLQVSRSDSIAHVVLLDTYLYKRVAISHCARLCTGACCHVAYRTQSDM
jgi:hypothetical protein